MRQRAKPHEAVAVTLAGCARFEPQPISPEETAARLDARGLDSAGLKKFLETNLGRELETWPLKSWDLNTLTLVAFYHHPSLDVARAQWSVAKAGIKTAGGRPNPTLNVTPGYNTSAGGLSPWLPFFSLDVPIETAGKRGHRITKAEHLAESTRLSLATVAWQVRSDVRANLLAFTAASQRVALLRQQLSAQEQIGKLLEQRLAAGAIGQPELTVARIAFTKTQLDLGDTKSKTAEARARLAEALGVSLNVLDQVDLAFGFPSPSADPLTSADARRAALPGRSDILVALSDYAAAQAALHLEIAKQFPDVRLSPGYQYDQGDNKWTLGMSVELPVLNQNQGPIAEAKARREEAAARFVALQARVISEIDRAAAACRAAREQLAASDSLLLAERQQAQSVEAQLKAGAADPLDLLSVQCELGTATLAQLGGQAKAQQALGGLITSTLLNLLVLPTLALRYGQFGKSVSEG